MERTHGTVGRQLASDAKAEVIDQIGRLFRARQRTPLYLDLNTFNKLTVDDLRLVLRIIRTIASGEAGSFTLHVEDRSSALSLGSDARDVDQKAVRKAEIRYQRLCALRYALASSPSRWVRVLLFDRPIENEDGTRSFRCTLPFTISDPMLEEEIDAAIAGREPDDQVISDYAKLERRLTALESEMAGIREEMTAKLPPPEILFGYDEDGNVGMVAVGVPYEMEDFDDNADATDIDRDDQGHGLAPEGGEAREQSDDQAH